MRRQCRVPKRRPRGDGSRGPRSSSPVPAPRSRCSGPSSTPPKPCGQGSLAALATMCILVASAALAGYAAGLLFDDVRAWALAHAALPLCNLALAPPATTVGAAVMLCAHQAAASRYGGEANETIRFTSADHQYDWVGERNRLIAAASDSARRLQEELAKHGELIRKRAHGWVALGAQSRDRGVCRCLGAIRWVGLMPDIRTQPHIGARAEAQDHPQMSPRPRSAQPAAVIGRPDADEPGEEDEHRDANW